MPLLGTFGSNSIRGVRQRASGGAGGAVLYSFTSATFTPGGNTGPDGPSLSQARNGLTGPEANAWKNDTQYFNTSSGYQLWTVPATGTYRIEVWGAQGGQPRVSGESGGLGARMRGDFNLIEGDVLNIVVGQQGQSAGYTAGGGGATFVANGAVRSSATLLIAAGGGGGGGNSGGPGRPGVTSQNGSPSQGYGGGSGVSGTNGNGGSGSNGGWGESGAGFLSNSSSSKSSWSTNRDSNSILSYRNGARGAAPWVGNVNSSCVSAGGGFGGAGGGGCNGGGGGGGYSGGGGGGAGSGSFNNGTNESNSSGIKVGDGQVTITLLL